MEINVTIFKEYDIRGKYPQELSAQAVYQIASAFFVGKKIKRAVIARDLRPESKLVLTQVKKAAKDSGVDLSDLGIQSTPALFFVLGAGRYDGGIMITASHSPKGTAGMKFGLGSGRAVSGLELKDLVDQLIELPKQTSGKIKSINTSKVATDYARFALSFINKNKLNKFKVVLDASDGSGAGLAQAVFKRLPVKTVKMNFTAGDSYLDHGLNPLLPENQESIIKEVKKQQADLGVIFDGDADRAVLIDDLGQLVDPYHLNCLIGRIVLEKFKLKKIVIDGRLTLGIKETISRAGGRALICRSGWANIVDFMIKEKILFGCENSGHFFINFLLKNKKNYAYGDALVPVLLLLEYLNYNKLSLSQAVSDYRRNYLLSGEINLKGVDFKKAAAKLSEKFKDYKQNRRDGLSITGDYWFANLRPSQTETLVRLNIEVLHEKALSQLTKEILSLIK